MFRTSMFVAALMLVTGTAQGQDWAKTRLDKSPRHGEYVDIKLPSGGTPIRTWIVYPERKDKAGVVIVIHEVYGLSDWLRGVAAGCRLPYTQRELLDLARRYDTRADRCGAQ